MRAAEEGTRPPSHVDNRSVRWLIADVVRLRQLPEKDHPARRVIETFKSAQRERLIQLCAAAALAEPEMLADELFLLLEGARVTAQSMGPKGTR